MDAVFLTNATINNSSCLNLKWMCHTPSKRQNVSLDTPNGHTGAYKSVPLRLDLQDGGRGKGGWERGCWGWGWLRVVAVKDSIGKERKPYTLYSFQTGQELRAK